MASRYREGAPVDDADAASEGELEVVVEAPPLEPEPAAKVAASEEAAPSHQQLLARTIHAEINSAACGFMQLHAALPRRFGDSRSRAYLYGKGLATCASQLGSVLSNPSIVGDIPFFHGGIRYDMRYYGYMRLQYNISIYRFNCTFK